MGATAAAVTAVLVYVALRAPTRCPLRLQLLSGSRDGDGGGRHGAPALSGP
ncbi:hypothetical protein GS470_25140 [Rhodococcus hoagii]|nr:hypothetical protein [Prescottella equi]